MVNSNIICEKLSMMSFNCLFKQMDLIVINWGFPIQYSLHVASAVRVCNGDKIILNLSDEYFTKEGLPKSEGTYEYLEKTGYINDPNSLLASNIAKVNCLLKGKKVQTVEVSRWKDLTIWFSDDIVVQIMQDCLEKDFEYYRFIEFLPHYEKDLEKCRSVHYVVKNKGGIPTLIREG